MAKDYPPHMLLQFGGYLGGGSSHEEIWSCSLRIMTEDGAGSPQNQDVEAQENYLDTATTAIKAWFTSNFTGITDQAKLTYVKCNAIAPNGKYLHTTTTSLRDFAPVAGAGTNPAEYKPFQVSAVVTIETERKRGLGSKGRIYVPVPAGTVDVNGKWSNAGNMASATATLFDALSFDDLANQYSVAVVSPGGKFSSTGVAEPVRTISVGNVLDTQRSRRNSLSETRVRATVAGQDDSAGPS